MKVETFACDVCQVQKKAANHWWRVYAPLPEGGVLVLPWDSGLQLPGYLEAKEPAHICGENHVLQWISEHLTKAD